MANAIHKTTDATDNTLEEIAALYYAVKLPDGTNDDVRVKRIVAAIRRATPISVFDLSSFNDGSDLGTGHTIFVPTMRDLDRVAFTDNSTLATALAAVGVDTARRVLALTPAALAKLVGSQFTQADCDRVWGLTALLNLDGMDRYTAKAMFDGTWPFGGNGTKYTMTSVGQATVASLDTVLSSLVTYYSRPSQLTQQRNGERWRREARIYTRTRTNEGRAATPFRAPVRASHSAEIAAHYERTADNPETGSVASLSCRHLAQLYRFQERLIEGNTALLAGHWDSAITHYNAARSHFHRLVEGALATSVDDKYGVNQDTAIDAIRNVLFVIPAEENAPWEAPELRGRRSKAAGGRYGLRGFRFNELVTTPGGAKDLFRTAIGGAQAGQLPRKHRLNLVKALKFVTANKLDAHDVDDSRLAGQHIRGLVSNDKITQNSNLNAVFDVSIGDMPLSAMGPYADLSTNPDRWAAVTNVFDVLSPAAQATYPWQFLQGRDQYSRFICLPKLAGATKDTFVGLDLLNFRNNLKTQYLNPRHAASNAADFVHGESMWTSPGSFLVAAVEEYTRTIPMGLRRAYAKTGRMAEALVHGAMRCDVVSATGVLLASRSGQAVDAFDAARQARTTTYGSMATMSAATHAEILSNIEFFRHYASARFASGDKVEAARAYRDASDMIEKVWPDLAKEVRLGLRAVYEAVGKPSTGTEVPLSRISLFNATYQDAANPAVTHYVLENYVEPSRTPDPDSPSATKAGESAQHHFIWNAQPAEKTVGMNATLIDVDIDQAMVAAKPRASGALNVFFWNGLPADLAVQYLRIQGRLTRLNLGLSSLGYGPDYVPPWSFDYLFEVARDLCNRALDAENRVQSLTAAKESMDLQEGPLEDAEAIAREERDGAEQRMEEALQQQLEAVTALARAKEDVRQAWEQLALAVSVAAASAAASAFGIATTATSWTGPVALVIGAIAAATAASVAAATALVAARQLVLDAKDALEDRESDLRVANAHLTTCIGDLSAAQIAYDLAVEASAAFDDLTMNGDGYAYLLGLAKRQADTTLHRAIRLSWLAMRALDHERRRPGKKIRESYDVGLLSRAPLGPTAAGKYKDLHDMTRAQALTADLEELRSSYVAGETVRKQEVKWRVALSEIAPGALALLRSKGRCSIPIQQSDLDRAFPGLYLHALKDVQVAFVGSLPPSGPRGVLSTGVRSFVRVPNNDVFVDGPAVRDDWTTAELATADDAADPSLTGYGAYVLKALRTVVHRVSMSEFDVRSDRAVLQVPQGMLAPMQHAGLNTIWALELFRQANSFAFTAVADVEFTFWFSAAFDPRLAEAQYEALVRMGRRADLQAAASSSFAHSPEQWEPFTASRTGADILDLRYLVKDVRALPADQNSQRVTNITVAALKPPERDLSVRVLCETDPVGVLITIPAKGFAHTALGLTGGLGGTNTDLQDWVASKFWGGSPAAPLRDPAQRWVLKLSPYRAGSTWQQQDANGHVVVTAHEPLVADAKFGQVDATGTYAASWSDVVAKVSIAQTDGTTCIKLRNGANHYRLEVARFAGGGGSIALYRSTSGTALATVSLSYPVGTDEYLRVEFGVWTVGTAAKLLVVIDQIAVLSYEDATGLAAGGLQLGVLLPSAGVDLTSAAFEDLEVSRLTQLGVEAETLYKDSFAQKPTTGWTFVDSGAGAQSWAVKTVAQGGTKHNLLDLAALQNLYLKVDYIHQMVTSPRAPLPVAFPGMVLLVTSDNVVRTANNTVTSWPDQSGAGNHLSVLVGSTAPIYEAKYDPFGGDGHPAVKFNNGLLKTASNLPAFDDLTCIAVYCDGDVNTWEEIVSNNYPTGFFLTRNGGSADSWGGGVIEPNYPYGQFTSGATDGLSHFLVTRRAGDVHSILLNGTVVAQKTGITTPTTSNPIGVGGSLTTPPPTESLGNGRVGLVAVWDRALSDVEIIGFYDEIQGRYGLRTRV